MTSEEFWSILHNMPESKPVLWRLYHDGDGTPIQYSTEDLPGTYIDVDSMTYAIANMNVCVRDGKLVEITRRTTFKLVPDNIGTPCHPDNVAVVVTEDKPHIKWSKQTYESN